MNERKMDHSSHISPDAIIHSGATVHPGAWIGPGVTVCEGVTISPGCVLGLPGPGQTRRETILEANVHLGPGVCVEGGVHVEEDANVGFGSYIREGSRIGRRVHLAHRCSIMGDCQIEHDARLLAEVYVCEDAVLHAHCQIMPGVKLLNDLYPPTALKVAGPVIGECAIIGANAIIWPGVKLGYHAMVSPASDVRRDVPDYVLVRGNPAEQVCDVRRIRMKLRDKWVYPYPWMRHRIDGDDMTKCLMDGGTPISP